MVLARAGEQRAGRDLARIVAGRPPAPLPEVGDVSGVRVVPVLERRMVRGGQLFPDGIPASWRGTELEAHGLLAGPASTLSFALRWHGPNAAVLWEVDGAAVELTAPAVDTAWRTRERHGEALWQLGR
jgi:hypothetical protein